MGEDIQRGLASASGGVPGKPEAGKVVEKGEPLRDGQGRVISKQDDKGNVLCVLCERPGAWIVIDAGAGSFTKYSSKMRRVRTDKTDGYIHQCCLHRLKELDAVKA